MTPPKPANDERPRFFPRMSLRAEERIGFWFSIAVIAGLIGFAVAVLDTQHWIGVGITLGVASVFIVGAALYRLSVYGRA